MKSNINSKKWRFYLSNEIIGKDYFVVQKIRTSRKVILILYRRYGSTGSPRAAWGMLTTSGLVKAQNELLDRGLPRAAHIYSAPDVEFR
jgi:hypothetical protein